MIETAVLVTAATYVTAAAAVGSSIAEIAAASEKTRALNLQQQQAALQTKQKTLSNLDVMEKTIDAQIAHQTTTGTAFSSPSFNAIQRNTLNIGARAEKNIELEGSFTAANIDAEKANVRNTLFAQLFGTAANTAFSAAAINKSAPTSGKVS
jgi:hypothetical protein